MAAITSIAEIPLEEREPLALLGFVEGRVEPDLDYYGFGWARLAAIDLVDRTGKIERVERPLLLALHSADDGDPYPDDVDLEFWLDDDDDTAIVAPLSAFLASRRPLLAGAPAIVLALCNPHRARLRRPAGVDAPIYHALGDVLATFDLPEGSPYRAERGRLRLEADAWRTIPGAAR
ncbi:MAG: hypothetical protein H6711_35120 [Myxococcales bacterium]|nr:hypothetical protein [Myxococcales bacterium]